MSASQQSLGHGSVDYNIESDQLKPRSRHALLHIPSTYETEKPAPLIVALHGKGQPPREFETHTQFSNPENNKDAIVVYPEGIKVRRPLVVTYRSMLTCLPQLQWTGDPESPPKEEIDDIAFVNFLIDQLEGEYSIDRDHIYVAGFSNGGGLTDLLACDARASSRIAAFAMSSAAVYQDQALKEPLFSRCNASRFPLPILEFHGDKDPVIHYDGKTTPDGPSYPVNQWLEDWVKRNGCNPQSQRELLYDGKVERFTWYRNNQEIVVHYYIHGFGHGWPTTRPLNNDEERHGPTYFDATPIVLGFFRKFSLSSVPTTK